MPRLQHRYWGYSTRLANSFSEIWSKSPYQGGYDVSIGTSDKGEDATNPEWKLKPFKHLLVVFGGLEGIEACIENDQDLKASKPQEVFDYYMNVCPLQGSRTIRTEEAIPITLTVLTKHITPNTQHVQQQRQF